MKDFATLALLSILIVMMNGINQIDEKEFINEQFNIKFEYPDEWKTELLIHKTATFEIEYDEISIVSFNIDPEPPIFNFIILTAYTNIWLI